MKFNRERVVKMGQQDLYQSDFYVDKSRFVDVFNGILFNGREIMKPEELETEDSVMVSIRIRSSWRETQRWFSVLICLSEFLVVAFLKYRYPGPNLFDPSSCLIDMVLHGAWRPLFF